MTFIIVTEKTLQKQLKPTLIISPVLYFRKTLEVGVPFPVYDFVFFLYMHCFRNTYFWCVLKFFKNGMLYISFVSFLGAQY